MKLLLKRSCFCCFLGFSCGSRIAQVRFKITHPGISIDVLASPCSPVLTAQPLDVVLRSKGARRKQWLERNSITNTTEYLLPFPNSVHASQSGSPSGGAHPETSWPRCCSFVDGPSTCHPWAHLEQIVCVTF